MRVIVKRKICKSKTAWRFLIILKSSFMPFRFRWWSYQSLLRCSKVNDRLERSLEFRSGRVKLFLTNLKSKRYWIWWWYSKKLASLSDLIDIDWCSLYSAITSDNLLYNYRLNPSQVTAQNCLQRSFKENRPFFCYKAISLMIIGLWVT